MNKKYYILFLSILFLLSCSDEGVNPIYGCMDENAENYSEYANIDDDSCLFDSINLGDSDSYDIGDIVDDFIIIPPIDEGSTYTYNEDIYEIFNQNGCLDCHNQDSFTGLDLSTYNGTMNGGNNGPIISDMSPASSLLITTFNSGGLMYQQGYFELPSQAIILTWISEGAPE